MKRTILSLLGILTAMAMAMPAFADRDYAGRHGYREHPYDKHRHYERYEHGGHRYTYRGHWRSWKDWDDYAREHRELYDHGRYYREGGHLMFRFCDPDSDSCFFFSIGR